MGVRVVVFLVFDGVKQLDVAGPAEVFAEAAGLGGEYELRYVSASGEAVRTSIEASLVVEGRAVDVEHADLVVLPGGDALPAASMDPELLAASAHLVAAGERVASVCTGAFLLAATGALDGRRAATHWEHAALLARRHPDVDVLPDALFVTDGRFCTSAGVTAGIDLALSLVEADHGAKLARDVARRLVVHMQRQGGQSQFSTMLRFSHGTRGSVRRAVDAVTADPGRDHGLDALARVAGVSGRHLARLFRAEIGLTPARFVEEVRLDAAKALLLGGETVSGTATRCGFGSPEAMRRLFVSRLGMPPSVYRERFATTAGRGS